jgi:hypothetical protein
MSYDIEVTKIKEHTRRKSRDEENERKDITITNDMCVKNERENTLNTFILWHVINTCHNKPDDPFPLNSKNLRQFLESMIKLKQFHLYTKFDRYINLNR